MRPDDDRRPDDSDRTATDDGVSASEVTHHLPAIDPSATGSELAAPPVDVDQRDPATHHAEPPDVIELPEHAVDEPSAVPIGDTAGPLTSEVPTAPATDSAEPPPSDESDRFWADLPASGAMDDGADSGAGVETRPTGEQDDAPGEGEEPTAPADRTIVFRTATPGGSGDGDKTRPSATKPGLEGMAGRLAQTLGRFLAPARTVEWTATHRLVLFGGAFLALVALLASSGGLALLIGAATVSVLLVLGLARLDVYERESTLLVAGVGIAGALIGLVIGSIGAWLTSGNWFDTGKLNFGAGGFGGRFAELAGAAPFSVWFLNGLVLPVIALAAICAVPVTLRRMPQFRNEVMDGVMLVATSAAGFAIGTALVYWWPMLGERGPQTSVGDWTLVTIGAVFLRPAAITLAGAMLGAAVWRYMVTPDLSKIALPAVGGAGAFLLLQFGSIQLQPAGLWPEVIWTLLIAVAAFILLQSVLRGAIATDRSVMGDGPSRVVCPNCRKVTPDGMFCANCGQRLAGADPA